MLDGLLDNSGKVAASAVFHENIENSSFSVDVAVMIAYNVVVMEVFEYIPAARVRKTKLLKCSTNTSATICFLSLSVIRSKLSSFLANIYTETMSLNPSQWHADIAPGRRFFF